MNGPELRTAREKLGMTQAELANALGIHANLISRWELSKTKAPPYLGLALEALLSRAESKPDKSKIYAAFRDEYFNKPGVMGVAGEGEMPLTLYVRSPEVEVPSSYQGLPVEVKMTGEIKALIRPVGAPAVFETWDPPEAPKVVVEPLSENVPPEKVAEIRAAIEDVVAQTPGGLPTQVYEVEKF